MSETANDKPDNVENEEVEDISLSDEEGTIVDGIRIPPALKPTCSFDVTGPRLIITKIENNFFKSYAKSQILGPFHKRFNAIVGPNGSGKSNVIDSMLFVFGYRATKIRSKKVSVLLHNSENFRNVQSCTVAVHFALIIDKEGDNYDIVPNSEFVVSRTANKDNSSYYMLNGRKVQFKEVGLLLKKHGIDLDHNRFLILQGEVEQIAMMKCKADSEHESGMLEYLEDIIGTSRYKTPLFQLNERVEILAEQRNQKLNRLRLVEEELNQLKTPMEEAVGFLKTENTIIYSKNLLYQINIYNLKHELSEVEENHNEVLRVQKELVEKLTRMHEEKSEKGNILKKHTERYENLQKEKENIDEALKKVEKKDFELLETMKQMAATGKKNKELIAQEKKKLQKLGTVPEESENGIKECGVRETKLVKEKQELEKKKMEVLANLRNETKELQEKRDAMENELAVKKKAETESKAELSLAEFNLKTYLSDEERERTKFEELKNQYETNKATIQKRKQEIDLLKKQTPETEKSLKEAGKEFEDIRKKEDMLVNEIRKKRSLLEERRSSLQAFKSQGKVLDSLMQQKHEGNCPGLYGRLGDLGAIDQKYDIAISTACGPLDNIVVDTVKTAQWCIEFLKKYDIGRATFIALDKQEYLRQLANSRIKTPENVHRLFDLIRIQDEDVRTAFYYALRDTLVADDLEQASRIAYGAQRFRVVTLKGELIELTGTMSGGGKTVSRGRMGQSIRVSNINPQELENLEETINQMELEVKASRQKQHLLEDQINTLQPKLRQMKFDYEKFTMEVKGLEQMQPELKVQVKQQEIKSQNTKADPDKVENLANIVKIKKEVFKRHEEIAGKLQAEVDTITKEIKSKTMGKMKELDKSINEVTKMIDKCRAEITRLRVAITTAQRDTKKCETKIKSMEQDLVDMKERLQEMGEERKTLVTDSKELLENFEEIKKMLSEKEGDYSEIKAEVSELTKQENKLKSQKVDIDQKVKNSQHEVNEYKGSIHQLEVKISRLKLQEIPNETVEELKQFSEEELKQEDVNSIKKKLQTAETHIKAAKPNLNAIEEYRKKQSVYIQRSQELEEISNKRAEMKKLYENLRVQRKEEFLNGYNIIKLKLKEMYQMITLGGDADFELVDSYDPFTEGIQFNVRPPKKSWKKISNLSGGEKTLSSLALVFALHYYKPSPLYVMDEIDAALDFKNVSIVGNYIKERTKNAQFIIISLRSNMFELCDNLIGIYKTYNCTQSITIDPRVYDQPPLKSNEIEPANGDNAGLLDSNENDNQGNQQNNLHSSSSSTQDNSVVPGSSSDLTRHSNGISEDMFSSESHNSTLIEPSFMPEQMEVDS